MPTSCRRRRARLSSTLGCGAPVNPRCMSTSRSRPAPTRPGRPRRASSASIPSTVTSLLASARSTDSCSRSPDTTDPRSTSVRSGLVSGMPSPHKHVIRVVLRPVNPGCPDPPGHASTHRDGVAVGNGRHSPEPRRRLVGCHRRGAASQTRRHQRLLRRPSGAGQPHDRRRNHFPFAPFELPAFLSPAHAEESKLGAGDQAVLLPEPAAEFPGVGR